MIDLKNEKLIPFSKLPEWSESNLGRRLNRSTFHRWRTRGIRGVKLETSLVGGYRVTTHESLTRFFSRTTAAAEGSSVTRITHSADISETERFLESEGIR